MPPRDRAHCSPTQMPQRISPNLLSDSFLTADRFCVGMLPKAMGWIQAALPWTKAAWTHMGLTSIPTAIPALGRKSWKWGGRESCKNWERMGGSCRVGTVQRRRAVGKGIFPCQRLGCFGVNCYKFAPYLSDHFMFS